jgi:branched-chain amino acid transport system permease protein
VSISKREYSPIITILIISSLLLAMVPATNHNFFIIGLTTAALIWSIQAASWDLLAGYTGLFNFGHMLFAGTAAYVVALLEVNCKIPRPLVILAGFLAGILSSLLIGLPSLRVRSVYFVLVSFVIPIIMYRITMSFTGIFGGEYGISIERVYSRESIYYVVTVLAAFTVIILRIFVKSRLGITLQSIREDEETARAVGINVPLYKLLACLISAGFGSLAGVCYFYHMSHVGPEIFSLTSSFNVVIMGLTGGMGTLFGAALGGLVLSLLFEFMRPISIYRNITYAALLVAVVMLFPRGLWGGLVSFWQKTRVAGVEESDKVKKSA